MIYLINATATNIPFPNDFFHTAAFSIPYWGLRKYDGDQGVDWPEVTYTPMTGIPAITVPAISCGWGEEDSPADYIAHTVYVMREVWRVLHETAVCWLNIADSYAAGVRRSAHQMLGSKTPANGLKNLDMCLIPDRLRLALQADGWYMRSNVIWAKPNHMPESVNGWRWERCTKKVKKSQKSQGGYQYSSQVGVNIPHAERYSNGEFADQSDRKVPCDGCKKCAKHGGYVLRRGSWRPTKSHEHVFMLAKSERYFADKYPNIEPLKQMSIDRLARGYGDHKNVHGAPGQAPHSILSPRENVRFGGNKQNGSTTYSGNEWQADITGRNLRDVWEISTKGYKGSHFAVWPKDLALKMLKGSVSQGGACSACGEPFARVVKKEKPRQTVDNPNPVLAYTAGGTGDRNGTNGSTLHQFVETKSIGWQATCDCGASAVPCRVLDICVGSGTTLEACRELGLDGYGLDISLDYLRDEATERLGMKQLEECYRAIVDPADYSDLFAVRDNG